MIILSRKLILISSALSALVLPLADTGRVSAACSMGQDHAVILQQRIDSADRLIADGSQIEQRTGILLDRFNQLREQTSNRQLAGNQSIDVFALYESLFKQYEDALNQYKQHRKDYFEHAQQYHQTQQPESIVGSSSQDPGSNGNDFSSTPGVLKFKAQDKCAALQQLEGRIISNETRLEQMVNDLASSMQKESVAMFASSWTAANQLAMENGRLASQYNSLGTQKTAWYSHNVHNFIAEANRDGAYGAHVQAYRDLSNGNAMEAEIYKRCQGHMQRATSTLSELASIRPPALSLAAPQPGQAPITFDQLQRESNTLDSEYANVQDLFAKLESVRKSMPPSLKKNKGITN